MKTITGSQHLIEVNGYRVLLDCGLFQGRRKEAFARVRQGKIFLETLYIKGALLSRPGRTLCKIRFVVFPFCFLFFR
jgi:metallo-beta-lactamase family protein